MEKEETKKRAKCLTLCASEDRQAASKQTSHDYSENVRLMAVHKSGVLELVSESYEQKGGKDGLENEDPKNWEHALSTTARRKAAQLAPGCVPWCWNRDMPVRDE